MTLSNGEIYDIYNTLINLAQFSFDAKASYAIIKNKHVLKSSYEAIEESRILLVKKFMPEGESEIKPGTPEFDNFMKAFAEIRAEKNEIEIHQFSLEGMQLSKNNIPNAFIELIFPLLKEE